MRNPECIQSVVQLSTVPWVRKVRNIIVPVVQMAKLRKRDVINLPKMIKLVRGEGRIWAQISLPQRDNSCSTHYVVSVSIISASELLPWEPQDSTRQHTATVCVLCRNKLATPGLAPRAVDSSSHRKEGAPWLIHSKHSCRRASSLGTYSCPFLPFQTRPGTRLPCQDSVFWEFVPLQK